MATYILIFLFEFISAYILWIIFRKIFKITKLYRIAMICLVLSLVVGYIASYRIVGYEVTMDYLTEINNQRIKLTGESITLEEENAYKKVLLQREDFKNTLIKYSITISLIPFIFVIFIMSVLLARKVEMSLMIKKILAFILDFLIFIFIGVIILGAIGISIDIFESFSMNLFESSGVMISNYFRKEIFKFFFNCFFFLLLIAMLYCYFVWLPKKMGNTLGRKILKIEKKFNIFSF